MSIALEHTKPTPRPLDDGDWYEVIDGQRREIEPMGAYENMLASELANVMGLYAKSKRLGLVAVEVLFELRSEPLLQRRPDVAFVSRERCRQHRLRRTNAWDVVPDLAIEFVSSTNLADEIDAKLVDYFATGVRQVWVVYPETRRLYVHESLQTVRGYSAEEVIESATVLPGFSFRLADLFDALENFE